MAVNINKFFRNDRTLILAYDHGLEHGPTDFNEKSVDPSYVLDIALEAGYTGVVLHHGIVEKYYKTYFKEVPLILKLNAHTRIGYKPLILSLIHI